MSYKLKVVAKILDLKEIKSVIPCSKDKDYEMVFSLEDENSNFLDIGKLVKSLCVSKIQDAGFVKAGRDTCFYIDKALVDSCNFKPSESNSVVEVETPHKIAHGLSIDFVRLLKDYSSFEVIGASRSLKGLFLMLDKTFEKAFVLEFGIDKDEK